MQLRQLKYFIAIVEFGSLTRAADAVHVAQSALSQQLALLESNLGVKLVNRTSRGATPTKEGELLYQHARTIVRQIDNTYALIRNKEGAIHGSVSIGMPSSVAKIIAIPLLDHMTKMYPGIIVELLDVPSADLSTLLANGRVDMAITPDAEERKGITTRPLLVENLYLVMGQDQSCIGDSVTIDTLKQLPLILPSKPNTLRMTIDQFFLTEKVGYTLAAEASTSAILVPAVVAGIAGTVLPWSAVHEELAAKKVRLAKLPAPCTRKISLSTANSVEFTQAAGILMDTTLTLIDNYIKTKKWNGAYLDT